MPAALARQQVQCFTPTMNLALIRQLGPAGHRHAGPDSGQPSYAILAGLTDQTATLQAAGTEQTVTLAALAQRWRGEFATLWRAPEGYSEKLRDGESGPVLDWVATGWPGHGRAGARSAPRSTRRCAPSVRAFQLAQGLPADGRPARSPTCN
jgi:general secretion pathway protein A